MSEIEDEIKLLSDEEKVRRIIYESNGYYKKLCMINLQSDELRIEMLSKFDQYDQLYIILNSNSDEFKLYCLQNMKNIITSEKMAIVFSINSEDAKLQTLSLFEKEYDIEEIILTFKSDEKKLEAMKKYIKKDSIKFNIINSLVSLEYKIANLHLVEESSRSRLIRNLKTENDEQRLLLIDALKNDETLIVRFIKELEDEEKKIQLLERLSFDGHKVDVILTLNEKYRISLLNKIKIPIFQDKIISSIQDDNVKIEHIQDVSDENIRCKILMSLQSDELKLTYLQKLKFQNETNIAMVISTLKDDELKLSQMMQFRENINRKLIFMSLEDRDKIKKEFLDSNRTYSKIGLDEKITIGIEIESEGLMSQQIMALKNIIKRQTRDKVTSWETKEDASLNNGVEVVSPILIDNQENVEEIYMICKMLLECGQQISNKCGGHIHIGADYLKSKEAYINLFEIWGNTEQIIYKISNEKGIVPRNGLQEYASPISPKLNQALNNGTINLENEEELEQFISTIQEVQNERYSGLNLLNINNGINTIEFRIPNGTINPETWIENIRLFGRMIQISQKLAEIEQKTELTEEDLHVLELKERLKQEMPEQEKMELLLELLFKEEERKVYRDRYILNSELLKQIPKEEGPFKETEFSEVDFKRPKHKLEEFYSIAMRTEITAIDDARRTIEREIKNSIKLNDDER